MIELYTANTPNNVKAFIALEELGIPYEARALKLGENEQKEPWYLKINPNGRTPTIIDRENNNFPVFESGAILIYLAEKAGKLLPSDAKARSAALQWLMFQMSGVGPMMGQIGVFRRHSEQIPFAIERYSNETRRLFKVLDARLAEAEYLAGEYSIADIATWPWVRIHGMVQLTLTSDEYPNLKRWSDALEKREACAAGVQKAADLKTDQPRPWLEELRKSADTKS